VSPKTLNNYVGEISKILNHAHALAWIDSVPVLRIYEVGTAPIAWLSREVAARLLDELPLHLAKMAKFSLATGLRESNVRRPFCILRSGFILFGYFRIPGSAPMVDRGRPVPSPAVRFPPDTNRRPSSSYTVDHSGICPLSERRQEDSQPVAENQIPRVSGRAKAVPQRGPLINRSKGRAKERVRLS
jgi:hypothetical protein